jgi:hypothetical protein
MRLKPRQTIQTMATSRRILMMDGIAAHLAAWSPAGQVMGVRP